LSRKNSGFLFEDHPIQPTVGIKSVWCRPNLHESYYVSYIKWPVLLTGGPDPGNHAARAISMVELSFADTSI